MYGIHNGLFITFESLALGGQQILLILIWFLGQQSPVACKTRALITIAISFITGTNHRWWAELTVITFLTLITRATYTIPSVIYTIIRVTEHRAYLVRKTAITLRFQINVCVRLLIFSIFSTRTILFGTIRLLVFGITAKIMSFFQ